jgi:hypothetical protein
LVNSNLLLCKLSREKEVWKGGRKTGIKDGDRGGREGKRAPIGALFVRFANM